MDESEAFSIAEQLENHYVAFAKLKDVITTARNSKQAVVEAQKVKADLDASISDRKTELEKLDRALTDRQTFLATELRRVTEETNKSIQDARSATDAAKAVAQAAIDEWATRATDAQVKYTGVIEGLKNDVTRMEQQLQVAKDNRDKMLAKLAEA